jgi:haloalkane dehalogenase
MQVLRTPDECFATLSDFPWQPHYRDWQGLRLAHIDEGPRDAPVALLVHGEPTWSYLYRRMIPGLLAAGYRVVAPDHAGFGRSDKPVDDAWYVIARHVEALTHLIETLDLQRITPFVQDWGGPIGLRQVRLMPARFERLVILNTWLHHAGFTYSPGIRQWREMALDPARLGGDMPTGAIVAGSLRRDGQDRAAVFAAYAAPFPTAAHKAGARRFPFCIPFGEPEAGQATEQALDQAFLRTSPLPKHLLFGDADTVFAADWGREWAAQLGATFDIVAGAGHFLQEEAGEEIVERFLARRGA